MRNVRGTMADLLEAEQTPVVVTAVLTAVPVSYAAQYALDTGPGFPLLLLLSVGAGVPRLYEHWTRRYSRRGAVAWTLVAAAVVVVEFTALYFGIEPVAGPFVAATAAFVVTDLGNISLTATLTGGDAEDAS